jgi:hypothetical protein
MKNWPTLLTAVAFALIVLATGCQPKAPELTEAEREAIVQEVSQTVEEIMDAMNDHNADRIMSYYLKSDDYTFAGTNKVYAECDTVASMVTTAHRNHPDWSFSLKPPQALGYKIEVQKLAVAA